MASKGSFSNIKLGDGFCKIIWKYPSRRWFNLGAYSVLKITLEKELQKVLPNEPNNKPKWVYEPHEVRAKVSVNRKAYQESGEFHVAMNMSDLRVFVEMFIAKHSQYRCYFLPQELRSDTEPVKKDE